MRKFILLLGLTVMLVVGCKLFQADSQAPAAVQIEPGAKQRGMSWTAERTPISTENFDTLTKAHVNWIVQTPFGWQRDIDSPDLALTTKGVWWGETDEGLSTTTQLAQKRGIQTLLKPHIWLTRPQDGKWRTDIKMKSEADWQTWFTNYRRFILHYAQLAKQQNIPILCIGTELQTTAVEREQDWRQLIAEIRQVYPGQLTYAANWYEAFEQIQFWDALDLIGIQAYFPLVSKTEPSVAELKQAWQQYGDAIATLHNKYQKPVIFTELGYRSTSDAAIEPWKWPDTSEINPTQLATSEGLRTQANCYEAFFQTIWQQDWFAGVYWWKWIPSIEANPKQQGAGFSPQNKPAEQVIRKYYSQSLSLAKPS